MSRAFVSSVSLFLAAIFAWAAAAKLARLGTWRSVLAGYRLPVPVARVSVLLVPLAELAVAGLLVAGATRAGGALSITLLSLFSLALFHARSLEGDRLPCGCFGGRKDRDYRLLLGRNATIALLPVVLLLNGRDVAPLRDWRLPAGDETIAALLVVIGLGVATWTARQVSVAFRKGRA